MDTTDAVEVEMGEGNSLLAQLRKKKMAAQAQAAADATEGTAVTEITSAGGGTAEESDGMYEAYSADEASPTPDGEADDGNGNGSGSGVGSGHLLDQPTATPGETATPYTSQEPTLLDGAGGGILDGNEVNEGEEIDEGDASFYGEARRVKRFTGPTTTRTCLLGNAGGSKRCTPTSGPSRPRSASFMLTCVQC